MNSTQLVIPLVTVFRLIGNCLHFGSLTGKQAIISTFYVSACSGAGENLREHHITAHLLLLRVPQVVARQSLNLPLALCATESGPGCWARISKWSIAHHYPSQHSDWELSAEEWIKSLLFTAEESVGKEALESRFVFAPHGMPQVICIEELKLSGNVCLVHFPPVPYPYPSSR